MTPFPFPKSYRLKSKKTISALFNRRGKRLVHFPLALIYMALNEEDDLPGTHSPVQHLIAVPKRKISKAHQRNLIRRRVREAVRHETPTVSTRFPDAGFAFMWMYLGKEVSSFDVLESSVKSLIHEFIEVNS